MTLENNYEVKRWHRTKWHKTLLLLHNTIFLNTKKHVKQVINLSIFGVVI